MEKLNEEVRANVAREQAAVVRALHDELRSLDPQSAAADSLRVQLAEEWGRLALYEAPAAALAVTCDQGATPEAEGAPRRPRVLVVEIDEGTRAALANWLSDKYEVVLARDGTEALEFVRARPPEAVIAYLEKPVDLALLERELRSALQAAEQSRTPAAR